MPMNIQNKFARL